jgi:hypothetical protein
VPHAYHLELSIDPAGESRKDCHCLYGTLIEIQRAIDLDFWNDFKYSAGLLYYAPERVILSGLACEENLWGKQLWTVNLLPFITVQGQDGLTFALDAEGRPVGGIDRGLRNPWEECWEVGGVNVLAEGFIKSARAWVDWSRVPLGDLPGRPIRRYVQVWLATHDIDMEELDSEELDREMLDAGVLHYGWQDLWGAENYQFEAKMAEFLALDPAWLTAADRRVLRIAESARDSRDFSSLGVLADALEEAGCDNELLLWHCRLPPAAHARGSWVVDFLLEQSGKPTA